MKREGSRKSKQTIKNPTKTQQCVGGGGAGVECLLSTTDAQQIHLVVMKPHPQEGTGVCKEGKGYL